MDRIEYRHHDKSTWGDGPWQSEPDKVQWMDPATGLPCLITRAHHGALCGYVGVPADHPAFGKSPFTFPLEVHGGVTFAETCDPTAPEAIGVCHIPGPGEPDHVWWFGFDCAHAWDITPAADAQMANLLGVAEFASLFRGDSLFPRTYREFDYVQGDVTALAAQLHALGQADQGVQA